MEELKPFIVGLQRPLYKQNTKEIEYIEEVGDELEERMYDVIDKVIKATADAMVGDYKEGGGVWKEAYNTRILKEKALRDEITQ